MSEEDKDKDKVNVLTAFKDTVQVSVDKEKVAEAAKKLTRKAIDYLLEKRNQKEDKKEDKKKSDQKQLGPQQP